MDLAVAQLPLLDFLLEVVEVPVDCRSDPDGGFVLVQPPVGTGLNLLADVGRFSELRHTERPYNLCYEYSLQIAGTKWQKIEDKPF